MRDAHSTNETNRGEQALAVTAQDLMPAGAREANGGATLTWLEDIIFTKLVCRESGLPPLVERAQRIFSFTEFNDLIAKIESYERPHQLAALSNMLDLHFNFRYLDNLKLIGDRTVILFGNHPIGGGNVLGLSILLANHFPDYRIIGNRHLSFLSSLADKLIPVDPFRSSAAVNLESLLKLRSELGTKYQALGIFPAGNTSQLKLFQGTITDRAWSDAFVRIARHHNALLVPIWFSGRNRLRYYLAGKVRTELGYLALPAEFLRLRGKTITVSVGKPITPEMLRHFDNRRTQMSFLRACVYEFAREPAAENVVGCGSPVIDRTIELPHALDGTAIGQTLEAKVFESSACVRIAQLADTAWRRDLAAVTYHVVLTPPDRLDPRAYWQLLDWRQFTSQELDAFSPVRRAFQLPPDVAATSRHWLEIVSFGAGEEFGRFVTMRQIWIGLRKLLAASPMSSELVSLLRPPETNATVASLQLGVLQKSFGDVALLSAHARVALIDATRHHDWRPSRDIAGAAHRRVDAMNLVDPMLRNFARMGIRFGAVGLSEDLGRRPCILGRFLGKASRLSK